MGEWQDNPSSSMADEQAEAKALAAHRRDLNRRLRAAFIAGAEEDSRSRLGRGLSEEELRRVLRRYPGDLPRRQPGRIVTRPETVQSLVDPLSPPGRCGSRRW
jgi:hypothetical protein